MNLAIIKFSRKKFDNIDKLNDQIFTVLKWINIRYTEKKIDSVMLNHIADDIKLDKCSIIIRFESR